MGGHLRALAKFHQQLLEKLRPSSARRSFLEEGPYNGAKSPKHAEGAQMDENRCYVRHFYVGDETWVLSARLVYRSDPQGLACNELCVIYAVSARQNGVSKRRVIKAFAEEMGDAIEWLARLPADDPPDFSAMGIEVE